MYDLDRSYSSVKGQTKKNGVCCYLLAFRSLFINNIGSTLNYCKPLRMKDHTKYATQFKYYRMHLILDVLILVCNHISRRLETFKKRGEVSLIDGIDLYALITCQRHHFHGIPFGCY